MLIDQNVKVRAEAGGIDPRGSRERCDGLRGGYEAPSRDRCQLGPGHAIPRHDEPIAAIQRAHDFTGLVSKLALG
ncbi:MAG: hypothetical protein M3024_05490 [Candidatus Dormibacteraeota bacterium]|nr:hypothetical protein [Candidatus Dormibacteraeota bacterium]